MSNQSELPKTYAELKLRGYPQVIEHQNSGGNWTVQILPMKETANAFPGIITDNYSLDNARDEAWQFYKKWMDEYIDWVEQVSNEPTPQPVDKHSEIMTLLTEIRDELRMMNRKPLYVVVNNAQSVKEFADAVRRYEEEVAIVEQIRKEDNQS